MAITIFSSRMATMKPNNAEIKNMEGVLFNSPISIPPTNIPYIFLKALPNWQKSVSIARLLSPATALHSKLPMLSVTYSSAKAHRIINTPIVNGTKVLNLPDGDDNMRVERYKKIERRKNNKLAQAMEDVIKIILRRSSGDSPS
mmetsp:Transcript_8737/g.10089  ORF Transcript_8737/g.10089 Transcript_8737/m.10089 type:complete len:144 (+) Transcript_8737:70-501(+)